MSFIPTYQIKLMGGRHTGHSGAAVTPGLPQSTWGSRFCNDIIDPLWSEGYDTVKGLTLVRAGWCKETTMRRMLGVMVGEWGTHNQTPHDVTLRWMEDCLKNFKQAGMGWALWNLRGSLGVMDSGRADVRYEDFHGHKLDRQMLDLLQRY